MFSFHLDHLDNLLSTNSTHRQIKNSNETLKSLSIPEMTRKLFLLSEDHQTKGGKRIEKARMNPTSSISHPPFASEMLSKNLALATESVENRPSTAIVAVLLPNFSIPLDIIQVW